MNALRVLIGLLLVAIFMVAIIPLLVLLDLSDGGTGWGLCPNGLGSCRTSYFDGFELLAFLAIVLFALLGILHLAVLLLRRLQGDDRGAPLAH